jgi:hypothetical protein
LCSVVAEINSHLDREPRAGLEEWRGVDWRGRHGGKERFIAGLRAAVGEGSLLPMTLLRLWEVYGDAACGAWLINMAQGNVGCSPAAITVWLGDDVVRAKHHHLVRSLDAVNWLLGIPCPDGSRGRLLRTYEEIAYVVQVLSQVRTARTGDASSPYLTLAACDRAPEKKLC